MFEWLQHDFMIQAFVACGAMGLLLAYLGIHVVGRGIIIDEPSAVAVRNVAGVRDVLAAS